MYNQRFVIYEEGCKLYFRKKIAYGYNWQNQSIYKAFFSSSIMNAQQFRSIQEAYRIIDTLPPHDTFIHWLISEDEQAIKLANLMVLPITLVYDS